MDDKQEIIAIKANIFDLMVQQETLQQQYAQLEKIKQAKLTELRTALSQETPLETSTL